jgi:hypothetical protein
LRNIVFWAGAIVSRERYVSFFLGGALPEFVVSISRVACVGLRSDADGLAQIFGGGDLDLLRFAETALELHEAC